MTDQPSPSVSAGGALYAAIAQMVRWAGRGENRRKLMGRAGADLTPTDSILLAAIAESGPLRASDMARALGVDKSTVTPQVRRLERLDLIERRPDPSDGRAALLAATARGRRLHRAMDESGAALFDRMLGSWSPKDRAEFVTCATRFANQLYTDETAAGTPRGLGQTLSGRR